MKYIIIFLLGIIVLISCGQGVQRSCNCVQQGWGSLDLSLPLTQNSVLPGSTFTLNQSHLAGSIILNGAVHPNMTINTGQWASEIVYKINQIEKARIAYFQGAPSNAYTRTFSIANSLQLGTNTISVEAVCTQAPSVFCPIATFTIVMTTIQANINLSSTCCQWNSIKLLMSGTFTGGTSVPGESVSGNLKIEKEIGSNSWVQEGPLVPFVNGGTTPCYPRGAPIRTQRYRATIIDLASQPITNNPSGTTFPMIFDICYFCCDLPVDPK